MGIRCQRCGTDNLNSTAHCIVCGKELKNTTINKPNNFFDDLFGISDLNGKVININPTYFQPPDFNWNRVLIFLVLFIPLIYLMTLVIVFLIIIYIVLKLIGININLFNIFFGLSVLKPPFQQNSRLEIPVQDIIVQDSSGKHLVRIKGLLKIGNVSVGDSIYVKGKMKGGMLVFKSGYNHSINSDLKLQRKIL
jgi:hypothetical protein